ncbi:MAG: thioredoxin family protein [Candidatus Sigynarchaeota archaeon]
MKEIETEAELAEMIGGHDVVVCDFFTTWCGPCKALSPVLAEIAEETKKKYGAGIEFCKVDCEKLVATADELGIRSIPTVVFYVKGKPDKDAIIGCRGKEIYVARIDKIMKSIAGQATTTETAVFAPAARKKAARKK